MVVEIASHVSITDPIQALIQGYRLLETIKLMTTASIFFYLYNIMLSLDEEFEHVWCGGKWTFPRIIYICNRLTSAVVLTLTATTCFMHDPTFQLCRNMIILNVIGNSIIGGGATGILVLRIWIMYGQRRRIFIVFGTLYALTIIFIMSNMVINLKHLESIPNPVPSILTGCLLKMPNFGLIEWIVPLLLETSIFATCVWKTWKLNSSKRITPLLLRLMRDGSVYYIGAMALLVFMIIVGANDRSKASANGSA